MSRRCILCSASHLIQDQVKKWYFLNKTLKRPSEIALLLQSKYDLSISERSVERHLENHVRPHLVRDPDFLTSEHGKADKNRASYQKQQTLLLDAIYGHSAKDADTSGHKQQQTSSTRVTNPQDLNSLLLRFFQRVLLFSHDALLPSPEQQNQITMAQDLSKTLDTLVSAFNKLSDTKNEDLGSAPVSSLSPPQISQIQNLLTAPAVTVSDSASDSSCETTDDEQSKKTQENDNSTAPDEGFSETESELGSSQ